MAYVVFIHAPCSVTLPAAAFTGTSDDAARPWSPAERCREVLAQFATRLDDVAEVTAPHGAARAAPPAAESADAPQAASGALPPCATDAAAAAVFMCRARSEGAVEALLEALALTCGIGNDDTPMCGTVSVLPVEVARPSRARAHSAHGRRRGDSTTGVVAGEDAAPGDRTPDATALAGARVLADRVLLRILGDAGVSFDYLVLATVASLLAGIGLATNSAVMIVAAMLVSPLMGPVLGLTFGAFVRDASLCRRSFVSEVCGLGLALASGLLVGAVCVPLASSLQLPTFEMTSRGDPAALIVGVAVALLSGAGVALSITGDNASSLVGVAISASLLPPVVNAGMCWCLAMACATGRLAGTRCEASFASLGAYSLALTAVNIGGIVAAAIVMFWIKEVSPRQSRGAIFDAIAGDMRSASSLVAAPSEYGGGLAVPPITSATERVPRRHALPGSPAGPFGSTFAAVAAGPLGAVHEVRAKMTLAEAVTMIQASAAAARPYGGRGLSPGIRRPTHVRIRSTAAEASPLHGPPVGFTSHVAHPGPPLPASSVMP